MFNIIRNVYVSYILVISGDCQQRICYHHYVNIRSEFSRTYLEFPIPAQLVYNNLFVS